MNSMRTQSIWLSLSAAQRAQLMAVLVQMLLRQLKQERRPSDDDSRSGQNSS